MNDAVKQMVENDVKSNKVMVYMRGEPEAPRCGFSHRVVKIFNDLKVPFGTRDMDATPDLWATLAELNDWKTSPQIYINGEFIGGADIVAEMSRNGELAEMLRQ